MSERVHVQFDVLNKEKFLKELQTWTDDANNTLGYRADDYVSRRAALVAFVDAMEVKLRKNEHKKNWREKPIRALVSLMLLELEEFKVALEHFAVCEARPELVDVSNFAMICWDRLGMLDQERRLDQQESPST